MFTALKESSIRAIGVFVLIALLLSTSAFVVFAGDPTTGVQKQEQIKQEENQKRLIERQPAPQLDYSVERENLIERMKRQNDPALVGYIYLLADTGQVIATYVTKSKPTSMGAYLTSYDVLIDRTGKLCSNSSLTTDCYTVESPDYDGAYGTDPDGIFFFTDTGAMVEWSGRYVWTDQPLIVKTPVSLERQVQ